MRDDIFVLNSDGSVYIDEDGDKQIDVKKVIGKYYGNGWFSNLPNCRYRIYCGARGTKKSTNIIGYESVFKLISDPRHNIVVLRQNDCDNRNSTFEQICRAIGDLGMDNFFKTCKNPLSIEYIPFGNQIIFRGLNNPTSLNGIVFKSGTYWLSTIIDEAYEVQSYDDFRKVDLSMRGRLPEGLFFQITLCLNPWNQDTWIYQEFFKGRLEDDVEAIRERKFLDYYDPNFIGPGGKGLYLHKSCYLTNEFHTEEYCEVAEQMEKTAPNIWLCEFMGCWGNAAETCYPEFNESLIKPIQFFIGETNGVPNIEFADFTIGIDTGLSDGAGHIRKVKKGEDASKIVRSATAMTLCAISKDFSKEYVIAEYFHANDRNVNEMNTDNRDNLTEPQIMDQCADTIVDWMNEFGQGKTILMRGSNIRIFCDAADIGFRQGLELKLRERGVYNVRLFASTKLPIQSRIDFTRLMMAYGEFFVCDQCKNLIREFKNTRKGEDGSPRAGNDHACDSQEYAFTPMLNDLRRWKTFKIH